VIIFRNNCQYPTTFRSHADFLGNTKAVKCTRIFKSTEKVMKGLLVGKVYVIRATEEVPWEKIHEGIWHRN
jgi:hypothetical protein